MRRRPSGLSVEDETGTDESNREDQCGSTDCHDASELVRPTFASTTRIPPTSTTTTNRDLRSEITAATPRSRDHSTTRSPSFLDASVPDSSSPKSGMLLSGSRPLSVEGSPETLPDRQFRFRSPWSTTVLSISTALSGLIAFVAILHAFLHRPLGADGCVVPMMTPTYLRMVGFDAEHTRFASKYNLFLYREEGIDPYSKDNPGLNGVPVLFIPGNAGSYKQVRSLASEASRYYHDVVRHDKERLKTGTRSLDFFMVDFNEDMAAFHGQTLLDQAEYVNEALAYILSLYHDPRRSRRDPDLPDPSSVILIGHSMGGIVARTALTMTNYQANSVNTIITMSTPHEKPPVSFDSDLVLTYKQINDYWRAAYSQKWANNNPLWHVTLISIAGGARDTVIPSDYASLAALVPETHGFTVFTSTMPNVWVGTDHLSITWCDQFRKAIIKSLFDIVDVRRPSQTRPRAERMRIFKKWYLTGLESVAERSLSQQEPTTALTLEAKTNNVLQQGERLVLRALGTGKAPEIHFLPIPPQGAPGKKFTLLTDQSLDPGSNLEVLFCSVYAHQSGKKNSLFTMKLDLRNNNGGATRLACKSSSPDRILLPASTPTSKHAFDRVQPFSYLQYDLEQLAEYQFVAVVDKTESGRKDGWVIAEFSDSSDSLIATRVGLGRLLSAGLHVKLPAQRPMLTEIMIPSLHSSLLAYRLDVRTTRCPQQPPLFSPLLRQSMPELHESKFFVNVKEAHVNLHGVAPFMPPPAPDTAAYGVSFHLWSDPTCGSSIELTLQVDVLNSLSELVMRYRTVFAAFPLLVVALVLRKQFRVYDETGYFISFMESLNLCLRFSLPAFMAVLSLLAFALAPARRLPHSDDPLQWRRNATETVGDYTRNDLLLGAQDAFFWFLVPLFGLISVGVCVTVHYAGLTLLSVLSFVYGLMRTKTGYIRRDYRHSPIFSQPTPRRRIINTVILLLLVATVIPYQFAYMVACVVQIATCVRALWHARETRLPVNSNFFNYAHAMLTLMLWVLPINAFVLVVWAHNLAVHWLTPFSSHHNVLSVMPFLVLVETMTTGAMQPRISSWAKHVTSALLFLVAGYAALYGVSYAYLLHHLANLFAAWLVGVYLVHGGFSLRRLYWIFEGLGPDSSSAGTLTTVEEGGRGPGHLKKQP